MPNSSQAKPMKLIWRSKEPLIPKTEIYHWYTFDGKSFMRKSDAEQHLLTIYFELEARFSGEAHEIIMTPQYKAKLRAFI